MPAAVAEKPKPPQPVVTPAAAPTPRQAPPPAMPKAFPQHFQVAPAPAKPKAEPKAEPKVETEKIERKEPVRAHETHKKADARMFKDIYEVEKKKSPVPFIAVGAGLVIVAVVGFFLLRPKHGPDPAAAALNGATTQTQSSVPEQTPDTALPSLSEEKLKTVNPKPKAAAQANQNRPAEPLPTAAEAIVPPPLTDVSRLAVKAPAEKTKDSKTAEAKPTDAKAADTGTGDAKAAETLAARTQDQPPAKVETAPPQGSAAGDNTAGAPPAPAAKAKTGDLVDLAAVDEQPKVLKSVDPKYPAQALRFGKEGSVTVNALISETGAVTDTGILKGLKDDMGLERAAAEAVRMWKFQPAKKDGVNVKVWKPIVIAFKSNRSKTP